MPDLKNIGGSRNLSELAYSKTERNQEFSSATKIVETKNGTVIYPCNSSRSARMRSEEKALMMVEKNRQLLANQAVFIQKKNSLNMKHQDSESHLGNSS